MLYMKPPPKHVFLLFNVHKAPICHHINVFFILLRSATKEKLRLEKAVKHN